MLKLVVTNKFKKDLKLMKKRGLNLVKIESILNDLINGKTLELKYHDHALTGNYIGFRECHIEPDWLLIYSISEDKLILTAIRTGSHSDLF